MQDKGFSRTRPEQECRVLPVQAVASSPCGLDAIATAPWEYGPEFLSTLDGTFAVPAASALHRPARLFGNDSVERDEQDGHL